MTRYFHSPGLFLGSAPQRSEATPDEEEVTKHKRIHCRRYTNCLTFAASQNWPGFACFDCRVEEPLSAEDQKRDLPGLAMFLSALSLKA